MFNSEEGWLCLTCGTKYDGRKSRYKEKRLFEQKKIDNIKKDNSIKISDVYLLNLQNQIREVQELLFEFKRKDIKKAILLLENIHNELYYNGERFK